MANLTPRCRFNILGIRDSHIDLPLSFNPASLSINETRKNSSSFDPLWLQHGHDGTVARFEGLGLGKKLLGGTWSRVISVAAPQYTHWQFSFLMSVLCS
jgi:hypothetical protein